jgi:quinol monooxygenase YgiN
MIIIMGTIRVAAGEIERLTSVMQKQMAASQAEEGCDQYDFSRKVGEPETLLISERWRDQAALDAHFASSHMAEFNAALTAAKILSMNVVAYEVSGSRQLMGG